MPPKEAPSKRAVELASSIAAVDRGCIGVSNGKFVKGGVSVADCIDSLKRIKAFLGSRGDITVGFFDYPCPPPFKGKAHYVGFSLTMGDTTVDMRGWPIVVVQPKGRDIRQIHPVIHREYAQRVIAATKGKFRILLLHVRVVSRAASKTRGEVFWATASEEDTKGWKAKLKVLMGILQQDSDPTFSKFSAAEK